MIYRLLLLLYIVLLPFNVKAQRRGIGVYVRDGATKEYVKDTVVTFMKTDSTVLLKARPVQVFRNANVYRHVAQLPPLDSFIMKVEKMGYETIYRDVLFKKGEQTQIIDDVVLNRSSIQLKEVTVVGSKILMVNRGDTLVYNASAFQLSNGSMLDDLVRQLPGVELRPGGRITVNGLFVESLLINGRDFFRGDPKIALENLPAYYVDKVKVYHRTSFRKQAMVGDSVKADHKDSYVIDVQLKRDYAEGWLGNIEAGYGTDDRYLTKLFGMRYTRHSGLFVYGNVNNLNNGETADKDGSWSGMITSEGMVKTQNVGAAFTGESKDMLMEYGISAKLTSTNTNNEIISATNDYYGAANVFRRSRLLSNGKQARLDWSGNIDYRSNRFLFYGRPSFSYTESDDDKLSRIASLTGNPYDEYLGATIDSLYALPGSSRLESMLLNKRESRSMGKEHLLRPSINTGTTFKLARKWMEIDFTGNYENRKNEKQDMEHLDFGINKTQDDHHENRYTNLSGMNYDYKLKLTYNIIDRKTTYSSLSLKILYAYYQQLESGERQLFRLDKYDRYKYGETFILPSTVDSLQATIDARNSFNTTTMRREHRFHIDIRMGKWQVWIPFILTSDRLTDYRESRQRRIKNSEPSFSPFVSYYNKGVMLTYTYDSSLPYIGYLLDVRDDSDPQTVILGNGNLGSTGHHRLSLSYRPRQIKNQKVFNYTVNAELTKNAIAMSRSYDLKTGVTTFRPENINGNWSTWGSISYGRPVGKGKRLRITSTTDYRYHHSVDFSSIGTQPTTMKNTVHNLTVGETLKGEYRLHDMYVAATTHASWRRATSPSGNFLSISAWDYNYGVTLTKPLLKNLDLNTELMMWSRRGYTDRSMNDDCLIWNATVSYAFGRLKEWIVKLNGVDMLGQRSTVRHTMNAQGHTETWYSTIPSYWMVHLMYQFKKPPKKRT